VRGKDALRLIDRVVTRDMKPVAVGQMTYTPWCDEFGKVIDDGTIVRLEEQTWRWTAADPQLRWLKHNAAGMDVTIEDMSSRTAALALQGPTSARLLNKAAEADIRNLKYFRCTSGSIAGVPVEISRNGYTGDLGYEIWMPWERAVTVWDALMATGREFDVHPAGMLALDVARVEAGLVLIEVDYVSCRRALIEEQKSTPAEIGLGRMVHLGKESFVGKAALEAEQRQGGPAKTLVGLELDWPDIERLFEKVGLSPSAPSATSRVSVPVFHGNRQVGKATSTTWSPTLKKLIALATVPKEHAASGAKLQMEITVEATRQKAGAQVVPLPFFNPPRKTAVPAV
jgi:aminomethyltransferase